VAATYEVVTVNRAGREHRRQYTAEDALAPGSVIRLDGRDWLVEALEDSRAIAKPARYRLTLRHPDGHEEVGAMRRYRPDAPGIGHMFTTGDVSWQVVDEQLARDESGPYLEMVAERDFGDIEDLPNHELEHVEARREELPEAAQAVFERAETAGLAPVRRAGAGGGARLAEAAEYIDALILEEIEDDLLEQCGVNPAQDPRETWLEQSKIACGRISAGSATTSKATTTRSRSGNSATGGSSRRSAASRTRAIRTAGTAGSAGSSTPAPSRPRASGGFARRKSSCRRLGRWNGSTRSSSGPARPARPPPFVSRARARA
jgi:hypothetical protein